MQAIRNLETQQCRICYDSSTNLQLLTNVAETSPLVADKSYAQLLLEVCNINVLNDKPVGSWPQFICFSCTRKLKLAYDFIQHTLKINKLLQSIADLLQDRPSSDSIESPALDIPLEIKTEKDDEFGSPSQERKFQYSPVDVDNTNGLSSLQTNEICCNIPCSNRLLREYKNNNKINDKNEDDSIKEVLIPSTIEFISTDAIIKDDLEKFHRKIINNMDIANQDDDTNLECVDDNLLNASEIKISLTPEVVLGNESNESFPSTRELNRHKEVSHASKDSKIYCDICSQNFARPYNYRRHMKTVHAGKKKQMSKNKKIIKHLNYAVKIKTNNNLVKFTCNICGKTFPSHARLFRHKRYTHISDEDKITCNFCGRKFARPDNYQTHIKRMHSTNGVARIEPAEDTNSSRYCCNKCGCSYSRRILLFKHENEVHGSK